MCVSVRPYKCAEGDKYSSLNRKGLCCTNVHTTVGFSHEAMSSRGQMWAVYQPKGIYMYTGYMQHSTLSNALNISKFLE